MDRNRSDSNKNRGFYIAVCCCVLVVAIVGYVSWFAGNSKPNEKNSPENNISETQNIPEIAKVAVKEEVKVPERKSVPAEEKTSPASKNVIADDNTPDFKKPVNGKVIGEYSGDKLVYHKELSDWRSHSGVDFKAKRRGEGYRECGRSCRKGLFVRYGKLYIDRPRKWDKISLCKSC